MLDIPTLPRPPREVVEAGPGRFTPAPALPGWIQRVIVAESGALHNPEHAHLEHARLAFLWTNVRYEKKGKRVLGEARLGEPSGSNAWSVGRQEQQLERWFGGVPGFLITLDAVYVARQLEEEPAAVLALIEHELFHCAQKKDQYGMPAFDKRTGRPKWEIRPHDVEQFVGVIERYGPTSDKERRMAAAFQRGPTVAEATIRGVCGSCGREVA